MESNRIEGIARDGIGTCAGVAKTVVQSTGEALAEVVAASAKLARDTTQTAEETTIATLGAFGRVLGSVAQVSERAIVLGRGSLGAFLEGGGALARTAVRVTGDLAIEVVHAVRRAAAALLVPREEEALDSAPRAINGGASEHAS